jgi:two-component system, NtrC family, sensor kinase
MGLPGFSRNRLRLRARFALIVGSIVCAFCVGSALLLYLYLKEKVIQDTYRRGQIVFALMDGIGAYVGNTLRPKMFNLISHMTESDSFVAEAMSTTRIRHGVMENLGEHPEFQYRRVAEVPRNFINQADSFHSRMIDYFRANGHEKEWHGITGQDGINYFFIMVPVYVKGECLRCHGSPAEAPPGLIKLYGAEHGFGYREGALMGIESISISLSPALQEINQIAIQISLFGVFAMLFLFLAIDGTFLRLIGQPLRRMGTNFENIANGATHLRHELPIERMDEIGEVTGSFNTMAHHLAEAQETMQTNAEILQSIIDGITDPLALANADGSLSVLNHAYQVWIGRSSPAVLGLQKEGEDVPEQPSSPQTLLNRVFATGKPENGEWVGPDERCYFMHFYPVVNDSGQVHQVVHYVRDVTMHKQAESQMMQMEKMAAIGQLSAGVAHEINNPLSIILCYAKLLQRDLLASHPAVEDVRVIDRNAEACKQIVDGLLSFARHGPPTKKEKSQLNDSLISVAGMVEKQFKQEGISLITQLDAGMPEFFFDPERIRQVFINLLMNARQAMLRGGTITISTLYHPDRGVAETRIQDSGAGIQPENLDKIFNPFFTTKQTGGGTGLGLSVSFGIVKEHGGEISVESIPDHGSTFIVRLPVGTPDESLD